MSFRNWLPVAVIAFFVALFAYGKLNQVMNYTPVTATTTYIESECYLYGEEDGGLSTTTITSETLACDKAEELRAEHPAYRDRTVKGTINVAFDYVSPADQRRHSGELVYSYERYAALRKLKYGSNLAILAHKDDPERVMADHGAS